VKTRLFYARQKLAELLKAAASSEVWPYGDEQKIREQELRIQRAGRMPGTHFISLSSLLPYFFAHRHHGSSLDAGCLQQFGQFLARIKQARLHGVSGIPMIRICQPDATHQKPRG